MVEYYKINGGYFYKKNKNGEVTRMSSEVYKRNIMKGGAGADGGGDGGGGDEVNLIKKLAHKFTYILPNIDRLSRNNVIL